MTDLCRALEDCIACEPRPEWDASSLKLDYLLAMRDLDRPESVLADFDDDMRDYRVGGEPLPPNLVETASIIRRFLIREPERSRRVLRLAFANWLAHVEVPEERHRTHAVRTTFLGAGIRLTVFFYAAGPAAPAAARRIAPEALAQWLMTAPDAKRLLCQWPWPSLGRQERGEYRALEILLAEELYRREHGRSPSSEDELVGTYIKSLLDEGAAGLDDGTSLTVEDPRLAAPKEGPR